METLTLVGAGPVQVLAVSSVLAAAAGLVASLELWVVRTHLSPVGLLSPAILRTQHLGSRASGVRRNTSIVEWGGEVGPYLLAVRIMCAVAAIVLGLASIVWFPERQGVAVSLWIVVTGLAVSTLAVHRQLPAGLDGADQMMSIVAVTAAIALIPGQTTAVQFTAMSFLAAQCCLAYFTAGVAKLMSMEWRSGEALQFVVRTKSYGTSWLRPLLDQHRPLRLILAWLVILPEVAFPLAFAAGGGYLQLFLLWGVTFHVLIAFTMRLNTFAIAFPAVYPVLLFLREAITHAGK